MTTKLYLIRHCQATSQEPNAPLTAEGKIQAEELADFLSDAGIKRIVSSPFARAVQSIEPLAHRLGLEIETDPRLQERILSTDHLPNWRTCLRETFDHLDLRFPGGESSREAMQRASDAVQDMLRQEHAGTTAIVSHGNLSTLLLKHFDANIGFSSWEGMTTPDIFRILPSVPGATITRIWQPGRYISRHAKKEGAPNMPQELSTSARKVLAALQERGFAGQVVELPDSTRTAREAAQAVGCQVGQIVKSLVFRGSQSDTAYLVLASGPNRVDEQRLSELAGEPIEKADADFVRQHTGFAVGGVPPLGHPEPLATFIDEALMHYNTLWAAAGTPHAVFQLTPGELQAMTGGRVVLIAEGK